MQLIRKLLFPISLVYGLIVFIRNRFYDMGVFKSKTYDTPTICIGNLSVGGTGKTPMTELLIRMLRKDYSIAVLSRGYKRKTSGFVIATPGKGVEDVGDEPFQIYNKFPDITVAVDADRRNGIEQLEKTIRPDIILLDDAFQHRKVKPSNAILLSAYDKLYFNDWYLPTGDLRDSMHAAKRADLIIVTKCSPSISNKEKTDIRHKMNLIAGQKVLFSYLKYDQNAFGDKEPVAMDFFRNKNITLITGIANPKPLTKYLTNAGFTMEHLAFADHHFFSEKELELFKTKGLILTTEKDYMRLKGKVKNLYYIAVRHVFLDDGEQILKSYLDKIMK